MPHRAVLIPPSPAFWSEAARAIVAGGLLPAGAAHDMSGLRVVVPALTHAHSLKTALSDCMPGAFIPPRIVTLSSWLELQPPDPGRAAAGDSERLMTLYAELRQHGWLKKMFSARRNTDLLPLANMLLALSDELTAALLPAMRQSPDVGEARWRAALRQLPPAARGLLSDESQLVWSVWKSQLDASDPGAVRLDAMMRLARHADGPLVWISPVDPDPFEQAFLNEYAARHPVSVIALDWRAQSVAPVLRAAWPELAEPGDEPVAGAPVAAPPGLSLYAAGSLESEALHGAQTIIDWLQAGKSHIAIVAQDRVVARRIRALLERAHVFVTDETGWKLSTTRAAAGLAAWLDVIATRADTVALLDLLKSPFLHASTADKAQRVMAIELALRRANVHGGWEAVSSALAESPGGQAIVRQIAGQAGAFIGRRPLADWAALTQGAFEALGMLASLQADAAGVQVIALLESIETDCAGVSQAFSFPEWRAFLNLQLESTAFRPPVRDRRVVMLPLNGARLRGFDAVLLVGADADHLPSQPNETLFFANAVRRELGLDTRESRQRQQLRDFAELLSFSGEAVLSWLAHKNGEPNAGSPWIARLQLALARARMPAVPVHEALIASRQLEACPQAMPAPAAPQLLPAKLSASGYNSLVACPYQFFATRMLRLSVLDELTDLPEKRDYGDWLHRILTEYHETVRDRAVGVEQRAALLAGISDTVFADELDKSAAALAYYARWKKAMPAYLDWANRREAEGWRFVAGELWREKPLSWDGGTITLHGRIDRVDENDAGERAVLDYKTRKLSDLKQKLKETEDHQLAFYGLLSEVPVTSAHFVALDPKDGKGGDVEAPNFGEWQRVLEQQIRSNLQAVSGGAGLKATGIESICQYCAVRGLCRKGAW